MLVLLMQLDMSDSRAWLPKSLCGSVSLPLPDIPKGTKYGNHSVIQIHHLFPADTEGKNFGRAVGRKRQNKSKQSLQPFQCIELLHLSGKTANVMACSQLNPLNFILYYSLFNNFLAASLQAVRVPLWSIKSINLFQKSARFETHCASSLIFFCIFTKLLHYSVFLLCIRHLELTLHLKGSELWQ